MADSCVYVLIEDAPSWSEDDDDVRRTVRYHRWGEPGLEADLLQGPDSMSQMIHDMDCPDDEDDGGFADYVRECLAEACAGVLINTPERQAFGASAAKTAPGGGWA